MLDINTLKKGQIYNLLEFMVLVFTTGSNSDTLVEPAYLIEKFTKHFGNIVVPFPPVCTTGNRAYLRYCALWNISTENVLLSSIFCFITDIKKQKCDFRCLVVLFNAYFTGTTSHQHYRSVDAITRKDIIEPLIYNDKLLQRLLTLTELED